MKNKPTAEERAKKRANIKSTKKSLRTLNKTSKTGTLRTSARVVKYGAKSFARNIWLSIVATLVMTITLIVLFITIVATVILGNTAENIRDKIEISYYFKPTTSEETLAELTDIISTDPNVKSVETYTSAEEYAKLIEENNDMDDVISVLNDKSMDLGKIVRETTDATMQIKVYDADNLDSIKHLVSTNEVFVENLDSERESNYELNRTEISRINSWAKIAKNGGIIVGIIFLFISILVIFNTVRMAAFSRREEIYMMRLIGANKGFIRGPFIVEAQFSGLVAGILATTASYFGFQFLSPKLANYGIDTAFINTILDKDHIVTLYIAMVLLGVIIGSFASSIAARHYLKKAK